MGKATELDENLSTRFLTSTEIRERQAAAESGGDVEGTPDGKLVKRLSSSETVQQAPVQTWD